MSDDPKPAEVAPDVAGELAAENSAVESVELDPSDLAGFTANSPSIRHMLDKIDALTDAIQNQHDAEHGGTPIQWCGHQMCRTLEDWR